MKAIELHQYGSEDELEYKDIPQPEIIYGELLIRIKATSVNHLEVMVASGKMKENMPIDFPWIPGYDFAGIVERAPDTQDKYLPDDEVYAKCIGGSYVEFISVKQDILARKPATMDFSEAACVPHVGLTAWQALYEHGALQRDQKVLIHSAAGGVGMFAVQFAKYAGAFVYGSAGETDKEFVKSLGADVVIDYKGEDFTQVAKEVDLVIDLVGGNTQVRSFGVLRKGGRLVTTTGKIDDKAKEFDIKATTMVVHPDGSSLEEITELITEGKVRADVARVYPLSAATEAWKTFEDKTEISKSIRHGKIVLEV
ncbi:MAG: NADP-dependent oxidoreductase [Bacteroides sp.]|nr:NADP-dependent oxidoreductase [Bacteroides sp.]